MRRALHVLMATVVAILGWMVAPTPSAVAAPAPALVAYTYDAPVHDAPENYAAPERGPPAATNAHSATTYDAVDRRSDGTSARQSGARPRATYAYDDTRLLVQRDILAGSTSRSASVRNGDLSGFERALVAAKGADEAGALVRYDPEFASRNLLGQVGEGYARTPSGYTVSAHAAERIVYGAPGRSPTTLSRVDDILNNPTRSVMRPDGSIRVFQGKDWVAVRGSGPIHIITVMVR